MVLSFHLTPNTIMDASLFYIFADPSQPSVAASDTSVGSPERGRLFFGAEDIFCCSAGPLVDIIPCYNCNTYRTGVSRLLRITHRHNLQGDIFEKSDKVHGPALAIFTAEALWITTTKRTFGSPTVAGTRTPTGLAASGRNIVTASPVRRSAPTGLSGASTPTFARRRAATPCCASFRSY